MNTDAATPTTSPPTPPANPPASPTLFPDGLPQPIDLEVIAPGPALHYVTALAPNHPGSQFVDLLTDDGQPAHVGHWTDAPGQGHLPPGDRFAALRVTGPQFTAALTPGVSFAVRLDEVRDGARINDHVRVAVFAGPDPDHRAQCGVLVMRRPEGEALQALLGAATR